MAKIPPPGRLARARSGSQGRGANFGGAKSACSGRGANYTTYGKKISRNGPNLGTKGSKMVFLPSRKRENFRVFARVKTPFLTPWCPSLGRFGKFFFRTWCSWPPGLNMRTWPPQSWPPFLDFLTWPGPSARGVVFWPFSMQNINNLAVFAEIGEQPLSNWRIYAVSWLKA